MLDELQQDLITKLLSSNLDKEELEKSIDNTKDEGKKAKLHQILHLFEEIGSEDEYFKSYNLKKLSNQEKSSDEDQKKKRDTILQVAARHC